MEEALALLEDGLARHPDYLTAMVILGRTLMEADRPEHAAKVLVRVLDRDPDNFVALGLLAEDAWKREIWHLAIPWLDRLVELEPQQDKWRLMLAQAQDQSGDHREPASDTPAVAGGFATMTMVDIYIEQGYLAKALAALRLIQSHQPGRADVQARLADVKALLDEQGDRQPGPGTADRTEPSVPGSRDMTARRLRDKRQFSQWIDSLQPGEGKPS